MISIMKHEMTGGKQMKKSMIKGAGIVVAASSFFYTGKSI